MPRRFHRGGGGLVFHVINRGVRRSSLFETPADFTAFLKVLCEAAERIPMRLLDFTLMHNHWHLVLWPREDGDLARYVGWASMTHACRWHRVRGTLGTGPVYQGRFKAIPIETGERFLTLCRYVERNPVRAKLVARAEDWLWGSASKTPPPSRPPLHEWPVTRPQCWQEIIGEPESAARLDAVRRCVSASAPFGGEDWSATIVKRLGWRTGLRPAGRPACRE